MKAAIFALALLVLAGACSTSPAAAPIADSANPPTTPAPDAAAPSDSPQTTTTTSVSQQAATTTTSIPAPGAPLVTLPANTPLCEGLQEVAAVGKVQAEDLIEISGIAVSRTYPSVIWAHNDSGGEAIVYALATDGTLLSTHRIGDAFPLDMEDIAIGPGPDPTIDYLYVGDIGDNLHFRPDVLVYRIPEPNPFTDGTSSGVEKIRLTYPEAGVNSEALAVDPVSGDLFLFEKTSDHPVAIYRAPADLVPGGDPTPLELAGVVGIEAGSQVTGADISPTGDRIALRGYDEVWVWPRSGADIATTLQEEPCEAASPDEVQGEALAFSPDATVIFTISEGSNKPINQVGP